MLDRVGLFGLGIAIACLFWPLEAVLHAYIFGRGSFLDKLLSTDVHEIWMRSIISLAFISFGWVGQKMLDQQRQLQNDFQRQKERLQKTIDSAYDAYISMDCKGLIIGWNRSAENLFGWTLPEAMGRKLAETIMPDEQQSLFERGMTKYLDSGVGPWLYRPMQTVGKRRDGTQIEIEMVVVPLKSEGCQEFFAFIRPLQSKS